MFTGGKAYYYHYDALGSTANLTSNTGAKQWTYAYEPFGGIRTETKNNTNAPVNLMRFTGELFDTDTGLYHLRARQYDPGSALFNRPDPMYVSGWLPYQSSFAYVSQRPTAAVDPSGLCFLWGPRKADGSCWGSGILDKVRFASTAPFTAVGKAVAESRGGECLFDGKKRYEQKLWMRDFVMDAAYPPIGSG